MDFNYGNKYKFLSFNATLKSLCNSFMKGEIRKIEVPNLIIRIAQQ